MKLLPADESSLALIEDLLVRGEAVIIPTETVYGIACDAFNSAAIDRIYEIKGREQAKRISWLAANIESVQAYADIPKEAEVWLNNHTTMVLNLRDGSGTQGFRIPANDFALQLLQRWGRPIACTSANRSGEAPATNAAEAAAAIGDSVAAVIDGGACSVGVASRVVDFSGGACKILR